MAIAFMFVSIEIWVGTMAGVFAVKFAIVQFRRLNQIQIAGKASILPSGGSNQKIFVSVK